ncbi:hypothetical protein [Sphingobium sp. MK2]|uniref:hypothetical protein n=1 Tax=Sphingobium sp. MK2 TaxID=3116540 RepID=UPI0032E35817
MNITPKIDYALLGEAVQFYKSLGYEYREVPWVVPMAAIDATLPADSPRFVVTVARNGIENVFDLPLVGSAEQGFITLDLPPGRYVGVTPCFRVEDQYDILRQSMFMKVELFDNTGEDPDYEPMVVEAQRFFRVHGLKADPVQTDIGHDLMADGIEVGSYGVRSHDGKVWAYGTGLALPRFSVAKAFQSIVN